MIQRFKQLGPGLIVAAAFIGPGTVITASRAGATYGYALMWAVVFSVIATLVLQEMSARLGIVARVGLGGALRSTFPHPVARIGVIVLVLSAILVGNAAFEMGNISGAAVGLTAAFGLKSWIGALAIGVVALILLAGGAYRLIERVLIVLVGVMSITFLVTAILVRPSLTEWLPSLVTPHLPKGSLTVVIGLIGTTVVPYNLFLHSGAVQKKWTADQDVDRSLAHSRFDTLFSIVLGGLITSAIVACAASAFFAKGISIDSAAEMAEQLEPLAGPAARYLFALGLLAAGLTSAITAPLAAAYATGGILGFKRGAEDPRARAVALLILVIGTVLACIGYKPLDAILFAQATNGILLPVVAIFLLIVVNRTSLLGRHTNGPIANILGVAVVLVAAGLGVYKLVGVVQNLLERLQ